MYTPNSCNPLEKIFYRPIDAAIRWCNLMVHESLILESATECPAVLSNTFPQWPNAYLGENGAHKGQRKPRSLFTELDTHLAENHLVRPFNQRHQINR
jgi:hypothetical protein